MTAPAMLNGLKGPLSRYVQASKDASHPAWGVCHKPTGKGGGGREFSSTPSFSPAEVWAFSLLGTDLFKISNLCPPTPMIQANAPSPPRRFVADPLRAAVPDHPDNAWLLSRGHVWPARRFCRACCNTCLNSRSQARTSAVCGAGRGLDAGVLQKVSHLLCVSAVSG